MEHIKDTLKRKLKHHQIRATSIRMDILALFHNSSFALSHADVTAGLPAETDRVTIYRTLTTFLAQGLIHKISDDSNTAKYALCSGDNCHGGHHEDQHLHFRCSICCHTFCIEPVQIPSISLPLGYNLQNITMTAEGVCQDCNRPDERHKEKIS